MSMPVAARRIPHQFGTPDVGITRYFALYLAQAGWIVLGVFLMRNAIWPSTCTPHGITDAVHIVTCSIRLPENRGWVESSLMTWLWTTPMLLGLEISRRWGQRSGR